MNLGAVMDEAATAVGALTGLSVFRYPPSSIDPPAAIVSYPQSVDYDETYRRGTDQFTDLEITLVVGRVDDLSTRDQVAAWSAGSGGQSVKAALEAHRWVTCDDLTINSCEFEAWDLAGVPYLAAIFKATAVGPGTE